MPAVDQVGLGARPDALARGGGGAVAAGRLLLAAFDPAFPTCSGPGEPTTVKISCQKLEREGGGAAWINPQGVGTYTSGTQTWCEVEPLTRSQNCCYSCRLYIVGLCDSCN